MSRDPAMENFINCTKGQIRGIALNAKNREAVQRAAAAQQRGAEQPVLRRNVSPASVVFNENFIKESCNSRSKEIEAEVGGAESTNKAKEGQRYDDITPSPMPQVAVDEIIKLKLQIANQQSVIDTQSTKLHNLEVKYHGQIKKLEEEKRGLTEQVNRYQERERSPASVAIPNDIPQAILLDLSNRDKPDRDIEVLKDKNKEFKRENLKLYCELELTKKSISDSLTKQEVQANPTKSGLTKHSSYPAKAELPRTNILGWY